MASLVKDLLNNTVRANTFSTVAATTGTTAGSSADFVNAENPVTMIVDCFGPMGALSHQIKAQESTDGTTWADITGASIAAATTTGTSAVTFNRSLQYLRGYSTILSATTGAMIVKLIAPVKQIP
jgi:hypothetical protein